MKSRRSSAGEMDSGALVVVHAEKESNLRKFDRVKSMKLGTTDKDTPLLVSVAKRPNPEK